MRFSCPCCGQAVELSLANLASEQTCPHCAEELSLQIDVQAEARKGTPASTDDEVVADRALTNVRISGSMHEAVGLEGDVVASLQHDPEVQQVRRKLIWGAAVVVGLILAVVLWNRIAPLMRRDETTVERTVQLRVKGMNEPDKQVGLRKKGEPELANGSLPNSLSFEEAQNQEEGDPALQERRPEPIRIVTPRKAGQPK